MARPQKNNADYFPHDNDMRNDRRCKALRSKFNLEGYAVFVMLLETLTGASHFQIEDNKMELELIAGDIDIDSKKLNAILEYLIKLGLLVKQGDLISSPMLNDLKNILNDIREKDRGRKIIPSENPIKENSTKENEVFHTENEVFQSENTQSKVKESKEKKRKENKIKEKGNKENSSPIFFNDFSFSQKIKTETGINPTSNNQKEIPQEKSSAKKETLSVECLEQCQKHFLKQAPFYAWENKDSEQLVFILQKIVQTKPSVQTEQDVVESFCSLLAKLPEYWRTKKFTISNLNFNYNEIVNEIRTKNLTTKGIKQTVSYKPPIQKPPEKPIEKTPEEKKKIRIDFINSICDSYQKFTTSGERGYVPYWVMFELLVDEKILNMTDELKEKYRSQAIDERKRELSKPAHQYEARIFKNILENFSSQLEKGDEKHKIEIAIKNLAVKGLFEELKNTKTDIKTMFTL